MKWWARRNANRIKGASLILIYSATIFLVSLVVPERKANWAIMLSAIPLAIIYVQEKRGKVLWFEGMSLPALLLAVAANLCFWFARPNAAPIVIYAVFGMLLGALAFFLFRAWAYKAKPESRFE